MGLTITVAIIAITVIAHLITQTQQDLKRKMLFNAYQIKHGREYWRWLSHGFIHADISHIGINMFVLFMFGPRVEYHLMGNTDNGLQFYIILYLGAILISSARSYIRHQDNPGYNALGASGATSAIVFASIIIDPVALFYGFMPAFIFGVLYLMYEHFQGKRGGTGIAHDAHFWGAVFGAAAILLMDVESGQGFIDQISIYFEQRFG